MKIFTVVLLVVAAIAAYFRPWESMGAETAERFGPDVLFDVRRGDLEVTITENGSLKAKNSEKIQPKFRREGTITWLIEEGTTVKKDDLLVEFDRTELEAEVAEEETKQLQYEAELTAAKAELAIQERDNAASIEGAILKAEIANLELERYEGGDAPNEQRKMRLALEKAMSQYQRRLESFTNVPKLQEEGFLTPIQAEEERIALREAEINKENAEKELELHLTYTERIALTQKETAVKDAERQLENAKEKATINKAQKEASLRNAERKLQNTKDRLRERTEELGHMTVKAPEQGVVHFGDPRRWWGQDDIKVGSRVHRGNTIITLPDLSEMLVVLQVHEADIDAIKEGMRAVVTVEAVKGTVFGGSVTKIASVASSEGWRGGTGKTFEVELTVDPFEGELRAGITAKAEIQVKTLEDVLYIPVHAVYAENGEHFCFIVAAGEYEQRLVTIGENNAHFVAVSEGVELGESVLLYDPRESGLGGQSGGSDANDADEGGEEMGEEAIASGKS